MVSRELGQDLGLVCYDRSKRGDLQRTLVELSSEALVGTELGVKFDVELVHRGIDPLYFSISGLRVGLSGSGQPVNPF